MLRNVLAFMLFVAVVGCGSKYDLVPVKGKVTLDGEPLAHAVILTQPIGKDTATPGPGSAAVLDENGEFELELQIEETLGAVPGEHRIIINERVEQRASSDDTVAKYRPKLPEAYRDGSVTYTIPPEGTDQMVIEIETKKRR